MLKKWISYILPFRITPVAQLKKKRIRDLGNDISGIQEGKPKKILFNSQFCWNHGPVEYTLATSLKLRGHDVRMNACGGLPDYCELQTSATERPLCSSCLKGVLQQFDAFGLPFYVQRDFATDDIFVEAKRIAHEQDIPAILNSDISGVPVGKIAWINLFHYFKGYPFELKEEKEAVFRRCVNSAVLITKLTNRLFDTYRPDVAVTVNGKFLQWAPFAIIAKQRGIPFVTWEDLSIIPSGVIFDYNDIAHEQQVDKIWAEESKEPISEAQRNQLREHFRFWAEGKLTPFAYYDETAIKDEEQIKESLGLRKGVPVVSLFPNVTWDSTSVGFDGAFESMFDWIFKTVAYAQRRPDVEFVVRAHPAEKKLPEMFHSTTPVCKEILQRYDVPENVKLIDPLNPISSYALASISNVVMTYTSTLGIEFALNGKRPWVAGNAYYAGKGFTLDLKSPSHMFDLLDKNQFDNRLTPEEIELAERFACLTRFRRVFPFPYLGAEKFDPPDFNFMRPGGNPVIDDLCDRILNGKHFFDIGKR